MESAIDTVVNQQLNSVAQNTWASQGQPLLDAILTLIGDEYASVQDNIYTYIQEQTTTGEAEVLNKGSSAQAIITTEGDALRDQLSSTTEFKAKNIQKDIVKPLGTAEKDALKIASEIE